VAFCRNLGRIGPLFDKGHDKGSDPVLQARAGWGDALSAVGRIQGEFAGWLVVRQDDGGIFKSEGFLASGLKIRKFAGADPRRPPPV